MTASPEPKAEYVIAVVTPTTNALAPYYIARTSVVPHDLTLDLDEARFYKTRRNAQARAEEVRRRYPGTAVNLMPAVRCRENPHA